MSVEENKALIRRWEEAFNTRDFELEAACRSADYAAHVSSAPAPLDGAGWVAFLSEFAAAFPDAQLTLEGEIGERDTVAHRWSISGTHQGAFQGVPATGRQIQMAGVDVSRVVDGKVVEHWAQFDVVGVLQQIGALPAPA